MNVTGKTIVITGGTSGIGLELVKKLADDNQLIVVSRKGTLPETLLNGKYPVRQFHANLASKVELEDFVDQVSKSFDSIDILINNAAIQCDPVFLSDEFNYDAIQTEIDINFTSVCHLTYLFLPLLLAAEKAEVINMNSGLAIAPKTGSAIYCATKSAMDSFSKSLSYQLEKTSVDVRQVFLPLVDTRMTEGRGTGKLQASDVAGRIVKAIASKNNVIDIGKVSLLRAINYLTPSLAQTIMKRG